MKKSFIIYKNYIIKRKYKFAVLILILVLYYFSLPKQLFIDPTATVITSAEGDLLGAKIAADMQWRFPELDTVPVKFKKCITSFEDGYFYLHWGFNPVSMFKALKQNKKEGRIVRGGSTITQQVIRLSRKNKPRTYIEKIKEIVLATRLEFRFSKDKILNLYASHAPFGGNVVGLDAAAWKYFGQNPEHLSWAENATLAVLPNAPSLIHIDKNRKKLKVKRNRLLKKLLTEKTIDTLTYELAIQEDLPSKTDPLPRHAPHLLEKIRKSHSGERVATTIQLKQQQQVNAILKKHYTNLKQNHIYNAAVLVIDVKTREIIAYVGNTPTDKEHQKDVDVVDKQRSTGSIIKPFLYTSMLNTGELLPHTLIADVPIQIAGYKPQNFDLGYNGAVPASKALSKSLNIPAVKMLQQYGLSRFYQDLTKLGFSSISKGSDHYGLSLILGGAESNLWEISKTYANLANTLNHYDETQGQYYKNEFQDLQIIKNSNLDFGKLTTEYPVYDAGSIYTTFNALREVNRPEGEENWEFYDESQSIAWKTGTSFGFRDAWAVGVNPDYVVGVWVGNADGEGKPGLTGIRAAAPILFDVFKKLPTSNWFNAPYDELEHITTCSISGHLNTAYCQSIDTIWVPRAGLETKVCPYHQRIHLDKTSVYRVNSSCESLENMKHENYFVLPPLQSYYYKLKHPFYKTLPPFRNDCISQETNPLSFVNNFNNQDVFLPKNFNEQKNSFIVKVKHRLPNTKIYWYLDSLYITTTQELNEVSISTGKGTHILVVIDEFGNEIQQKFTIIQ